MTENIQTQANEMKGILAWIEKSGNKLPDPVFIFLDPALSAQVEIGGGTVALAIPQGDFDGRLLRGTGRIGGTGCRGPVVFDDHPAEGGLVERV